MELVHELVRRIDPAAHPHAAVTAAPRLLERLVERGLRGGGEEPPDAISGPEGPEDQHPGGNRAGPDEDQGGRDHRPIIARASAAPAGPSVPCPRT